MLGAIMNEQLKDEKKDRMIFQALFSRQERELVKLRKSVVGLKNFENMLNTAVAQVADPDSALEHFLLSGAGAQIQSVYTGIEFVVRNILNEIDQALPSGDAWHKELLNQANSQVDLRPPLISDSCYELLDSLRGFRHFIRNSYGVELSKNRVIELSKTAIQAVHEFDHDLVLFKVKIMKPDKQNIDDENKAEGDGGGTRNRPKR
jgi:hypothetical protein